MNKSKIMNSDPASPPRFSDESHKVASLSIELWRANPALREREVDGPRSISIREAANLLSLAQSLTRDLSSMNDQQALELGRFAFDPLLKEDKQANLPKGQTRTLGRINQRPALLAKIGAVFPSSKVFAMIGEVITRGSFNHSNLIHDGEMVHYVSGGLPFGDDVVASQVLALCNETEKASLVVRHLSIYTQFLRNGFVPSESNRYPFQGDPENERSLLFRSSEDICESGWLSKCEVEVLAWACHTLSKTGPEKR